MQEKTETIKEFLLEGEKEESFLISDVAKHGCSGGTISELIYYDDTVKFHDKHEEEIWKEIDYACECVGYSPLQWINQLNGGKSVGSIKTLKNLLAWWICEAKANEIIHQDREEVAQKGKMNIEILRKKPTWSLKVMIKALSQPISSFLNTDEDNERLENAKKVIKERKTQ